MHPRRIGRGDGRRLLAHAMALARESGARELLILSDPHAEGFYLRMGAERVGRVAAAMDGEDRHLPRLRLPLDVPR